MNAGDSCQFKPVESTGRAQASASLGRSVFCCCASSHGNGYQGAFLCRLGVLRELLIFANRRDIHNIAVAHVRAAALLSSLTFRAAIRISIRSAPFIANSLSSE